MHRVQHISINILCDWRRAYTYIVNPRHLPQWASGLSDGEVIATEDQQVWQLETPAGNARVRFAPKNEQGILDHWVQAPDGSDIYIPLRVIANLEGCTVIFSLFQLPSMDEDAYARDAQWIERDLQQLKALLEE